MPAPKHTTCKQCRKPYYPSFAACPYCAPPQAQEAPSGADLDLDPDHDLDETGEHPALDGSCSDKYPQPGVTDWLDRGTPDHDEID